MLIGRGDEIVPPFTPRPGPRVAICMVQCSAWNNIFCRIDMCSTRVLWFFSMVIIQELLTKTDKSSKHYYFRDALLRCCAVYVNACLINCWLFIHFLVRLAFRPSGGAPKGPQLATTIASSSTTLAPTPRHQRLTTVGGWCDPIIQPFLVQAFLFSGVSVAQKRLDGKIWYFGPKTSSEHTTKWAPLGPLKPSIPRSTRRVSAHIPIEQPTTIILSMRGYLGVRLTRGVQGSPAEGRPIHFVPSLLLGY